MQKRRKYVIIESKNGRYAFCRRVMGFLKGIKTMPRPKKNTTTKTIVKEEAAVKAAKNAEVKAVKPAEAEKPKAAEVKAAPAQAPKTEAKKPAAKKAAAKKAAEKPVAKKSAAKAEPAPKKRAARKPKPITVDDIVAKIYKKIDTAAAKDIVSEGKAAVDIKLYGSFEAHMYIEIKNGVVSVAPYDYIEKDIEAAISVENALAIADGKLTVEEAVENGALYVFGNVQFALMFAKLFK